MAYFGWPIRECPQLPPAALDSSAGMVRWTQFSETFAGVAPGCASEGPIGKLASAPVHAVDDGQLASQGRPIHRRVQLGNSSVYQSACDVAYPFISTPSRFKSTLATTVQAAASAASMPSGRVPSGSVASFRGRGVGAVVGQFAFEKLHYGIDLLGRWAAAPGRTSGRTRHAPVASEPPSFMIRRASACDAST